MSESEIIRYQPDFHFHVDSLIGKGSDRPVENLSSTPVIVGLF